ncbi:substrate-binding domain-containing protein [Terrabacter carboxydivorans]
MMSRRTAAGAAALLVGTALLATAPAALADPGFVPDASTDVVGVGSDTTMLALDALADGASVNGTPVPGYNAGRTSARLSTFDANEYDASGVQTNSTTVVLRVGATPITRPNGSGAGKNLLHGAGNNPLVTFARSSSANNATETSDGLWMYPFAKDTLAMGTRQAGTNAPASLTGAQIVSIYKGDVTNWSAVGGTAGTIKPLIPQAGSGTRSFFLAQLKALNGGVDVVLGSAVTETQEHSDKDIKNDPLAVAPFSVGRSRLLGTIRIESGWEAARAVYNVVRDADRANPNVQAIFGTDGFICSPQAKPLIAAGGLDQLASTSDAGVCGEATQTAVSDLTTSTKTVQTTTTALTASNGNAAHTASLRATVSAGATAAQGRVAFYEGTTAVGQGVLSSGVATLSLSGVAPGSHSYTAIFTPTAGTSFTSSQSGAASVAVLPSTVTLTPSRILDTRNGTGAPAHPLAANTTLGLQVSGRGGLPAAGVGAVILNVTATAPAGAGNVTAWPSGTAQPTTSNLNFAAGQTVPNQVIVKVGPNGKVNLRSTSGTHLIADVAGYYPTGSYYQSLVPARVMDTRTGLGAPKAPIATASKVDLTVLGRGGVPSSGVGAVVINVTAVPRATGNLAVWPSGSSKPNTSNLNFVKGGTVAGLVIAKVGSNGKVSLGGYGLTDAIVDVAGYFPTTSDYIPLDPSRIKDTRVSGGAPQVRAGGVLSVQVRGAGGVPAAGATAVMLNVTAVNEAGSGNIAAYPSGSSRPNASVVNYVKGVTASNSVIAKIGPDGKVNLYTSAASNLIVDVQGYFTE